MRPALLGFAAALLAVPAASAPRPNSSGRIAVAVLGDSDSHSYHDRLADLGRGGSFAASTFNWIEIWARLRPHEIDPGPFAASGGGRMIAAAKALFSVPTRVPRKEDYLYNYSWSGTRCAGLMTEWPEEARNFIRRIKAEPERWRDGLVVIRIGVNDFGQADNLNRWASAPLDAAPIIDGCLAEIAHAAAAIRRVSDVHIALIGIAHDYETPMAAAGVPDETVQTVAAVLDRFDTGLVEIAAGDPRIAFVDDAAWLARRFGSRRSGGVAKTVEIAGMSLSNAVGDAPSNLHLADGHAGTIASGLFLQHLVRELNARFGWSLTPISDEDIVNLVR